MLSESGKSTQEPILLYTADKPHISFFGCITQIGNVLIHLILPSCSSRKPYIFNLLSENKFAEAMTVLRAALLFIIFN